MIIDSIFSSVILNSLNLIVEVGYEKKHDAKHFLIGEVTELQENYLIILQEELTTTIKYSSIKSFKIISYNGA